MRIAVNQVIAGLPAITARQLMRRLGEYITPNLVRQIVGCRAYCKTLSPEDFYVERRVGLKSRAFEAA